MSICKKYRTLDEETYENTLIIEKLCYLIIKCIKTHTKTYRSLTRLHVIPGISKDKTMDDKLMYISPMMINKLTIYVDYNYWLKNSEQTNQNSMKLPKVFNTTN